MKLFKKPAKNRAEILGLPARKWHRVYYMLTAFNVLVVLLGLFLNRELVRIYDSSVAVNQEWVRRLDNLNELTPLIGAINIPVDDVFETHAVDEESSKLSKALHTFDEHMAVVEEELRVEAGRENRNKTVVRQDVEGLQQDLAAIKRGVVKMAGEADHIFSYFQQGETDIAARHMALMDREYASVRASITGLRRHINLIQDKLFTEQLASINLLRNANYLIAGFVLLMIGGATIYGYKIKKQIELGDREKERYLEELQVEIAERRQVEAERQVLLEITQGVNTTSNLDELLRLIHQAIGKVLYAENCFVALYDKQTELFAMQFFVDQCDEMPPPLKFEKSRTAYVFHTGRPILMTDEVFDRLAAEGKVQLNGTPPASWLGIPLATSAEVIGVFVLQHYADKDAFSARDLEFLTSVGGQIALAIERKRNEESLAESERRHRDLVENSQGFICLHDLNGQLLSVNPAAARSLGYTPAEMAGRNLLEFIAPTFRHLFSQYLTRIATEPSVNGLMNVCTREGEERIWMYRNIRIEEQGKEAYVLGHAQDITESTRAEKYIDQLRRQNELLLNSVGEGIFGLDLEGNSTFVNLATARMLGWEVEELAGKALHTIMHHTKPDGTPYPREESPIYTAFKDGSVRYVTDEVFWRKDGTSFPVEYASTPILENGQLIGAVVAFRDVTERKQAEDALRQERIFLRTLIDNIPDSIYVKDTACRKVIANIADLHNIGVQSESEALGKDDFAFFPREIAEGFFADDQKVLQTGQPVHNREEYVVDEQGQKRWLLTTKIPLRDESKRIAGIIGMGRDVTERKQMEAELERARDAAVESARLKSEFLANMSHEIRTPMNGVIGMTGLLLDTDLTDEQRDFAETIRSSGDALLTIINDILDFSKIEAGKLQFEMLDFNLTNAVESTVELLAERARDKKIELASLIYSDVPVNLRGDAGRLRQVLTNLIGNALKFTETGEVIVRAAKESETDDHVLVRLTVTDTGIGISEDAQRKLFQAFTQADGSTTRKYGGTGLGLAISKQLIALMGGEIGVTSEAGKGSTFWFTAQFEKQHLEAVPAVQSDLRSLHGLRALIVDDNATNRKILTHQLNAWGIIHDEAESGAQALASLRAAAAKGSAYDLAILDLMMPGMNGFELARFIKADGKIANVCLVMLTSFGQRGQGAMAREAGVAAYLTKPVRQSQFFDCLTTVMNQASISKLVAESAATSVKLHTKHSLTEATKMSNKLILLAEDNIVNQKVAVRQLQKLGYRADLVANGREAIEALSRIPYDLVLMDCQMPEMDGYEAAIEIRRRERGAKHSLIVAMTANALEGDREKCLAAGMDDYISKPVKLEELGEVLTRLLSDANKKMKAVDQPSQDVAAPVDMERLYLAMGDEPEELADILDVYLNQMSASLEKLHAAIESGNAEEVNLISHNCAGVSANCGMTALVAPFRELERMGLKNQLAGARLRAAQVCKEFERAKLFLKENLELAVS